MSNLSAADLVIITVSIIGLTYILKYGEILSPIRDRLCKITFFKKLFSCSLCLGFWAGGIVAFVALVISPAFLWPLFGAAVGWWGDYLLDWIEKD